MMMMMMGSSRDGEEGHQAPPPLVMRAPQQALTPNHFVFGKLLGLGSYSKVMKVKRKDTGEIFALKVMDKKHIIRENKVNLVKMERMILDQLDFPGIIRLCFTFQDSYSLYMGLECCDGGELFDQIRRVRVLVLCKDTTFWNQINLHCILAEDSFGSQ
jgi:serine/threonine protein kinase